MVLAPIIVRFIRTWKHNRDLKKAKKFTETTVEGFWETYYLATTYHGRYRIQRVLDLSKEYDVDIDPKVLGMYEFMMITVPYKAYSILN